ncbi:class I SAM-dependent methyltransferase [Pseudalkalibacillus berkeleyi]|uniref:Class I SAM-dependent methyltransferase n=1 Tax=Pseudalkalibacillus berkeleyi TaxID=1069813 RepID=A0ABS9H0R7_9BACL|nr:class I SAM-dependent methyltransferase [Pseudalkalibacillus berkeleyi]MCF6137363.1 class I SAM-dependent methyltransferase [Pseudalkalibacillus berkeleyi]
MDKSISYEAYQEMADYYARYIDHKPFNAYYERPGTLSLLPDVENKKVLDAGCGAGYYTEWLISNGAQVTAVDFSENMVQRTKARVGNKADVIHADLNEPLSAIKSKSKDLIVSALTLHYLKDWEQPIKEFNRILKNKGRFVFSVHHPFMDFTMFNRENYFATELLTDEWETNNGKVEVQFYRRPLSEVFKPLYLNGFVIEKVLEPLPTEAFRKAVPEQYERLKKRPQFLFVRAQKTTNM